jgi:uncharacterized membrane protein
MSKRSSLLSGIGIGAVLMYVFDPDKGNRRRALMRDRLVHLVYKTKDAFDKTERDMKNRVRGLAAELSHLFVQEQVSDNALVERVRSRMGRVVSHPGSIMVTASGGVVKLSGPILKSEVEQLLSCIRRVRGVKEVINQLEAYEQPGDIPGLQGQSKRPGNRFDILQRRWSPTTRVLVGLVGAALALRATRRKNFISPFLGALGLAALARAITNIEMERIVGIGEVEAAINLQKSINIKAPIERVYQLWTDYENFPRFMRNVREVKDLGEGRSHWVVAGPAGIPVEWDAVITKQIPNELLAWETTPDSVIKHTGTVHFKSNPDGSTHVDIKLSYNPVAGAIGHVVASLFGADPKSEMDDDLVRMKTFIETGIPAHDAARREPKRGATVG